MYQAYLQVISQLIGRHQAVVTIEERQIFIDVDPQSQKWTVSTPLLSKSDALDELFPTAGTTRMQSQNHFLRKEGENTVVFFEKTSPLGRFIDFRAFLKGFLEKVEEFDTAFAQ